MSISRFLLTLTVISAGLYLIFALFSAVRRRRIIQSRIEVDDVSPAYFWGFAFAVIFYYGFPIWWWRYGLRSAVKITVVCIALVVATQVLLRMSGVIDVDGFVESLITGLLIAVPIRAAAGIWIAKNDFRLRQAINLERKTRSISEVA